MKTMKCEIHKTIKKYVLKHKLSIGRNHNGFYFIPGTELSLKFFSLHPTAKSGLLLLKRIKRDSA